MGVQIRKGVLLVGHPRTRKALLAKEIIGEVRVPFFTISWPKFIDVFIGLEACRFPNIFNMAKENFPCIIFIDELIAMSR